MGTELGVNIEVRGVSSCDVSQGAQWDKVAAILCINQYILLLKGIYEE
jgi:hypothetical protein